MSSAERVTINDIKTFQKRLLDPSSIVIYNAYVTFDYEGDKRATLVYYGAQNKLGGITDDWALILGQDVQTISGYEKAVKNNDDAEIVANANIALAKLNVTLNGADGWESINVNKMQKRIK